MTLDENDLRAGLRALTAAPPPAPADRAPGSVRRLRTLRRRRTGLAVATALAVALPLFAVVTRESVPAPVPQVALTTALLQWPERYGEGGREFGALAVDHLRRQETIDRVEPRLLYAGKVGEFMVAVLARCDGTGCGELSLLYPEPTTGLREVYGGRLDSSVKNQPIGWYLPATGGSTMFVLGPPGARHLRAKGIDVTHPDGVFVANVGYRTSFLDVRVEDARSRPLVAGRPGLPPRDGVPYATPLAPVRVPAGFRPGPVYTGQVGTDGGTNYDAFAERGARGTYRVFLSCRSPGKHVFVLTHTAVDSPRVPCDGQVHAGPLDDSGQPGGSFSVESAAEPYDPFATWSAAVGYPE